MLTCGVVVVWWCGEQTIIDAEGLRLLREPAALAPFAAEALKRMPNLIGDYHSNADGSPKRTKALQLLVGSAMAVSKARALPNDIRTAVIEALNRAQTDATKK